MIISFHTSLDATKYTVLDVSKDTGSWLPFPLDESEDGGNFTPWVWTQGIKGAKAGYKRRVHETQKLRLKSECKGYSKLGICVPTTLE